MQCTRRISDINIRLWADQVNLQKLCKTGKGKHASGWLLALKDRRNGIKLPLMACAALDGSARNVMSTPKGGSSTMPGGPAAASAQRCPRASEQPSCTASTGLRLQSPQRLRPVPRHAGGQRTGSMRGAALGTGQWHHGPGRAGLGGTRAGEAAAPHPVVLLSPRAKIFFFAITPINARHECPELKVESGSGGTRTPHVYMQFAPIQ
jgi:hypothetical protein